MESQTYETITAKLKVAYSIDQLSDQTSLSKAFLRNEIRLGRLKAKLVGRRVLVLAADADEYLKTQNDWTPGIFQGGRIEVTTA
jgi:hypothetical protein